MTAPMLWFRLYNTLEYDLPLLIELFQQKCGRKPKVLWTRDGQATPEGFSLAAKKDGRILNGELYLE